MLSSFVMELPGRDKVFMKRKRKHISTSKKKGASLSRAQMKKVSGGTKRFDPQLPSGAWEVDALKGEDRDSRYHRD